MAGSILFGAAFAVGAASAPAPSLRGSAQLLEGRCCFNGCGDESSCVTRSCATQELCLSPQPDGGCDSSPPFGHGAKPSWCPTSVPQKLNGTSSSAQASASLRTGTQNGGGDEENCVACTPTCPNWCNSPEEVTRLQSTDPQRSCAFWDGLDIKESVCPQQWQGQYAGTASCKPCWEGEDCGWTCDLTDGTKAGVDLQAYVHASHGEGYCARNPSNDPCLGWQVFGDGCSDCAASDTSSSAQASASLNSPEEVTHLQSTDPQRSCAFWDGLDIKESVCPQQWQGQYAGTASCKPCWEGEDCGWTCDLTDGTKAGVDLQAYVHASHGEGYCARNPSNDPCLGWQVFGDGCSDR